MGEMNRHLAVDDGGTGERVPRVFAVERVLLAVLAVIGICGLLFFCEYWFAPGHRRSPVLFTMLTFAVLWQPVRNVYNWWIYLWADNPETRPRNRILAGLSAMEPMDVITTAMPGEPFPMFKRTLTAISMMKNLNRAFLMDGGNNEELRTLCAELGITHVDCRSVPGAKAGKVNHCLRQFSRSALVLVIDPDHIPKPEFLTRVAPWFSDPSVGFVQVVQAYHNLEESWVAWGAAEQTFGFYGPTLMGLSGLGLATAIGANCTFRRTALESVGGHAEHLAEDALTSLRLHAAGWTSVYLPWRGSEGLVPSDLGSFWKQQLKWATGMTNILFRQYPRLFWRLSATARLHYLLATTYYMCGVAAALNLFLPVVCLFLHVCALEVPLNQFLLHFAPYLMVSGSINLLVQRWYSHRDEPGIPWRSMLIEKATWHVHASGFWYGLLGRKVPYLPTPKDGSHEVPARLMTPHWVVIVLSLAAMAWVPLTYHRVEAGTILMMLFASINALMLLPVATLSFQRRLLARRIRIEYST
jgi:cellulose synthase (UDP-forming)